MMAAATGLSAAAIALSVAGRHNHHDFYYTQLWIVQQQGSPDNVVVGLRNEEGHDESYAIELLVDGHLVQWWSDLSLHQEQTWTTTFRWTGLGRYPRAIQPSRQSAANEAAASMTVSERTALGAVPRVEALVYRANNRSVIYRHVWLAPECVTGGDPRGRPPCES